MCTEKEKPNPPRSKLRKIIVTSIVAIIVILILTVLFAVPAFVSSEKCRQLILTKVNDGLDGQFDFADISMGWHKGVILTAISFKDNASQTAATIKQISTKPNYRSILAGNLSFGKTIIDEPKIEINLNAQDAKKEKLPQQKSPQKKTF